MVRSIVDRDLISLPLMCVFSGSRLHNKTHVEAVGLESEPQKKEEGKRINSAGPAEEHCEMSKLSTRSEKEAAPIQLLCPVLAKGGPRLGVNAPELLGCTVRLSGRAWYLWWNFSCCC